MQEKRGNKHDDKIYMGEILVINKMNCIISCTFNLDIHVSLGNKSFGLPACLLLLTRTYHIRIGTGL